MRPARTTVSPDAAGRPETRRWSRTRRTRTVAATAHLAAGSILCLFYARALGGFVGAAVLIAVLVGANLIGRACAISLLRDWAATVACTLGFIVVRSALLAVLAQVALASASPGGASILQWVDAVSIAAAPVVAFGFVGGLVAVRHPLWVRWEPLVHAALLLALLWSQAHYELSYFERPWAYVVLAGLLLLFDLVLLVEPRLLHRRLVFRLASLVVPLLLLAVLFSFRWYSAGGTAAGGGILRPTLFRFDFAPFVRLESEISMSDDLVLLYRRSGSPRRELIRRYVLTEYDSRGGFSVADDPLGRATDDPTRYAERERIRQEYFLVNLDPQTRLALNAPIEFTLFESWDESSFTAAFAAQSVVSRAPPFRLAGASGIDMPPEELARLTDYGDNEAIRGLATEIAGELRSPFAKARAIEIHLRENYLYSLRPGIAADGDQLMHFLFESRKGYCSYYAFSMALMVRSLGIPARVAVGFFVDPSQEVLNFYPVLANMAHAWVEVYLGEYGWISFDPTSQTLAPEEEYDLGSGADPREVAQLLEEILAQELRPAEPRPSARDAEIGSGGLPDALRAVVRRWYLVLPLTYLAIMTLLRIGPFLVPAFARSPRRRAVLRVRAVLAWAAACGIHRRHGESLREFGGRVSVDGIRPLMQLYERALFAPMFDSRDEEQAADAARAAIRGIRRRVRPLRRVAAFLIPGLGASRAKESV